MSNAIAAHPHRGIALSLRDIWAARPRVSFGQSSDVVGQRTVANDDQAQSAAWLEVQREITAIRAYAHFVNQQSDMPADHRRLFLGRIIRCCDQASARIAAEASLGQLED